jgi:hypothetical protein
MASNMPTEAFVDGVPRRFPTAHPDGATAEAMQARLRRYRDPAARASEVNYKKGQEILCNCSRQGPTSSTAGPHVPDSETVLHHRRRDFLA